MPPGIREVLGTPPTGVAEQRLKSPVRPGVARRSVTGPSPGRGNRGRRLRSPSRIAKADFRPSKRYMRRPCEHKLASEITALRGLQVIHPDMGADELQSLNNQVLLMIAEYHLTSASQGTHHIQPVLPEGAARLMPPVDEYLPGSFEGCRDVRVTDWAQIMRIATWLHRLDLAATYSVETANSPQVEEYDFGPLLEYFLMPRLSTITPQEVAARVAQENRQGLEASLRDLHDERDSLQNGIELLTTALENEQQKERRKSIKKQLDSRRRELRSNLRRIARLGRAPGPRATSATSHGSGSPRRDR